MNKPSSGAKKIIDDLDILRAVSVIAIVVHHARGSLFEWSSETLQTFYTFFAGGFGPDLFFAISGFIIARDLVPRLGACPSRAHWLNESLRFWVKRIHRILPSAFFWLALILVLCAFFNSTGVFGTLTVNIEATVAAVLQVANFRFASTFMQAPYGTSFVYWTLSLEEQFYILLPFVAFFARRYLVHILVAVVLFQLVQSRSILAMMVRTDALLMGVLIAIWSTKESYLSLEPVFLRQHKWVGYLALLVVTAFLLMLSSEKLHIVPLSWSLISLLCAALVLVASYNGDYLMPPGILKRLMLWVGSRSYAIYLCHIPAFFFVRELMHRLYPERAFGPDDFWWFTLSASSIIVVCSELNYRILEVPIRRRGARVAAQMYTRRSEALAARQQ